MINIKNSLYQMSIDDDAGKIVAFGKNENLLADDQPPIFRVRFITESGSPLIFTALDANKHITIKESENKYSFLFEDFSVPSLSVKVNMFCDYSCPLIKWQMSVYCRDYQLEWIEIPGISVKNTIFDSNNQGKILLPYNEGVLVDDIDVRYGHNWQYTDPEYPSKGNYSMYPGMISSPFLAVMSKSGGIYLGAHDTSENTKCLDFYRYGDGVRMQMRIYPGTNEKTYTTDFDTVLRLFEGDWYDAADIYRDWFEQNKPKEFLKISENNELPKWYDESPVIIAYAVRGHYDTDKIEPNKMYPFMNALPMMRRISKELDSPIMVLLMHWEGTAPWAPPFMWPPYGGEEGLREYINTLHKDGNYLGLYCSGLGWTQKSRLTDYSCEEEFSNKNLKKVMCTAPDGSLPFSNICTAQRIGYDMCPSTEFCRETIVQQTKKMISSGVDYIQLMDQNHGGTPYFCYSKEHGHPPVPGKWQSNALKKIMFDINRLDGAENVLFGCESAAAQTFIPQFMFSDNRFEINYLLGEPVPLYSYLYHPYVNNFMGNQVLGEEIMNCKKSKDNLYFRIAYSFTAGDFLTLVINDEGKIQWAWGQKNFNSDYMPDYKNVIRLTKNLNTMRRSFASKYLHTGKMIKPFIGVDTSKHNIYAARRMVEINDLLTAAYETEDGMKGQIIVNYGVKTTACNITGAKNCILYSIDKTKGRKFNENTLKIEPLSSVLLVKTGKFDASV